MAYYKRKNRSKSNSKASVSYLLEVGTLERIRSVKKNCLVIYPRNFAGTNSFLALNDEAPHSKVPSKIDASNWRLCEMDGKEVIGA